MGIVAVFIVRQGREKINLCPALESLLFELFEEIFNYPDIRASISVRECISQEELIRWVNSQYQFLLTDRK